MNDIVEEIKSLQALAWDAELQEDAFVQNALQWLSIEWDPLLANSLRTFLLNKIDPSKFIDEIFVLPTKYLAIPGELILGFILGKPSVKFRIEIIKLPRHLLVAGVQGTGKSNFIQLLVEQALRKG